MTEPILLDFFLGVAFILAPLMTKKFFLKDSKLYSHVHKISLMVLLMGAVLGLDIFAVVWPLFCAFGFLLYLKIEHKTIFSIQGIATCIPFLLSLISAVWFFAGVNDLHLLGYDRIWSFYAALHGGFLGWLFIGCLAFLAKKESSGRVYLWGCHLCLIFFLCVAFGIDGIPYIKRVGVVGLSLLVPLPIGFYAFSLKNKGKLSLFFAVTSLLLIIVSMALAVLNEFASGFFPRFISGLPIMVIAHGFINALLAVPCFYLAIRLEREEACLASTGKDIGEQAPAPQ